MYNFFKKTIRFIFYKIKFSFIEKKYKNKLKYILQNNKSDELIIVFSGFANKIPKYNYIRTLEKVKIDKLFILDNFGCRGSYYWYENGDNYVENLTQGLIRQILRKGYEKIYTAGSSKGGTCAIYYGLIFGASDIFAGACQYHIGTYLDTENHRKVLEGMMGKKVERDDIIKLDLKMKNIIKKFSNTSSVIHLCYSIEEHTYHDHIVDMIKELKNNNIKYFEKIDKYTNHGENGFFFSKYLKSFFKI